MGKMSREYAANGYCLSVTEIEVLKLLDGVDKSMTIVEKFARSTLV